VKSTQIIFDTPTTKQKFKVRLTVEYEVEYPNDFDKYDVEFHRNESSWCAGNALKELEAIKNGTSSCICGLASFDVIE
jgi:hypothetical protein